LPRSQREQEKIPLLELPLFAYLGLLLLFVGRVVKTANAKHATPKRVRVEGSLLEKSATVLPPGL
jgi:hypothetical protein